MVIPKHTIDKVKEAVDIVDVISDFVELKKKGGNYLGKSPFTNEKTPSFNVVPSKNFFKDFSSGKAGDAFTFLKEHEGMEFMDAVKFLAKRYGIKIEEKEQTPAEIAAHNEKGAVFIALQFACNHFENNLKESEGLKIGHSYFKERGFNGQIIKKFNLGYSLDQWDGLLQAALKKGYNAEVLEKAGLIKINGEKKYDAFRGRVMFPIHNVVGKPIAFGARTLKKDDKPKYLNSPETIVYHKSDVLYGIFQGKDPIRKKDNCFLVEGYTDVISMHIAGVENVVASSGTALTEGQIRLIKRYTKNITLLFDGDRAGLAATIRGVDIVLKEGLNVKVVSFPEGEDPDSYSQKLGGTAFQSFLENEAIDFIDFRIGLIKENQKASPIEKSKAIKALAVSISNIPDVLTRGLYIQDTAMKLGIDESSLLAEINKISLQTAKRERQAAAREKKYGDSSRLGTPTADRQESPPQMPPPPTIPPASDSYYESTDEQVPPPPPPPLPTEEMGSSIERLSVQQSNGGFPVTYPEDFIGDSNNGVDDISDFLALTSNADTIIEVQEREFIRLLLKIGQQEVGLDKKVCDYLIQETNEVPLQNKTYQKIVDSYKENLDNGIDVDEAFFFQHEDEEIKQVAIDVLVEKYSLSENWFKLFEIEVESENDPIKVKKALESNIFRLKIRVIQKMIDDLIKEMQGMNKFEEQIPIMELLKEYKELEKEMATVLKMVISR